MADKMEKGKGKHELSEPRSSDGTWTGFTKKTGSLMPKHRRQVSHMMGEKIGKAVVAGVQNLKNKHKINPDGGDNA